MSYTEYLNRKKTAAPVVLDTRVKMDASTYTRHTRVVAAAGAYEPTQGIINNIQDMAFSTPKRLQNSGTLGYGGRVPDASTYTDYAAGRAAAADYKESGAPRGKVVLNGALTGMTSLSGCAPAFAAPTPANSASQAARDAIACHQVQGEPHNASDVRTGKTQFVDDTISLNSGTLRIGTGSFGTTGSTAASSTCPAASHAPSVIKPRAAWAARPGKGMGGIPVFVQPNPSDARKVGGPVPSDYHKYVESHHGNDLNMNPRRVPTPFKPHTTGVVAHLKINDTKRVI